MLHTRFTNGLYTSTCNTQQTLYQTDLVSLSCPSLFDNMHLWLSNSNQSLLVQAGNLKVGKHIYIYIIFLFYFFQPTQISS